MSSLLIKLDNHLHVLDMIECSTPGLASQKAREYIDEGYQAKIVPKESHQDAVKWFQQIKQQEALGDITPILEGVDQVQSQPDKGESVSVESCPPLISRIKIKGWRQATLSSMISENTPQKMGGKIRIRHG